MNVHGVRVPHGRRAIVRWLVACVLVLVCVGPLVAMANAAAPVAHDDSAGVLMQRMEPTYQFEHTNYFGSGLAIDGDTMAIGASGDPAVYIYSRDGGAWSLEATVGPADVTGAFGYSVRLDGDTLVVGASRDDEQGSSAGAVYVFVRSGASWSQQAKLIADETVTGDRFGYDVALSGDTIVAGAYGVGSDQGAAYVFTRSGAIWSERAVLQAPVPAAEDRFGYTVDIDGGTVVIGAAEHASWAGTAFVYTGGGDVWEFQQELTHASPVANECFSYSLSLEGDRVLVAAPWRDDQGVVYEYTRSSGVWSNTDILTASDASAGSCFGYAVALSGSHAVISDEQDNMNTGSAYFLEYAAGEWSELEKVVPYEGEMGDWYGEYVALDGDDALVCAYQFRIDSYRVGAAYVYDVDGYDTFVDAPLVVSGPGILANDVDFEGDPISAVTPQVSGPANGVLSLAADGSFTYTPDPGFVGEDSFTYQATDSFSDSNVATVTISVVPRPPSVFEEVAGATRYETAIKTSQAAFADDSADCVVIATGANWPDALGGAALASAMNGPILLTSPTALPAGVPDEIDRLGADEVYILGGTGAVSQTVEDALADKLGALNVHRIGGATRYETAEAVAAATIAELEAGVGYDGTAFLATGGDFPDALAASPLAAAGGWPIFLSSPAGTPPTAVMESLGVTKVLILGGTGAVSAEQEDAFDAVFGAANVERLAGATRYVTGVAVATYGVDELGLSWDGLALTTGQNFPDALAGGVFAGRNGSVMLLTASEVLPASVSEKLAAERDGIRTVCYLGGTGAVSQSVRDEVAAILH